MAIQLTTTYGKILYMTNHKLLDLYGNLVNIKGLEGAKFNYGIARNISLLTIEVDALKKAVEPSEEYNIFDAERAELAKKLARKNDQGEPVLIIHEDKSQRYDIVDMKEFEGEVAILRTAHSEAVEKREKQIEDFNKLLEVENNVELYKIKLEDVPTNIKTEQMTGIYDIIEVE